MSSDELPILTDPLTEELSEKQIRLLALGLASGHPATSVFAEAKVEYSAAGAAFVKMNQMVTDTITRFIKRYEECYDRSLAGILQQLDTDREYAMRFGDSKGMLSATIEKGKVLGFYKEQVDINNSFIALPDPTMEKDAFIAYAYSQEKRDQGALN